jgi:hypothetical protein
VLDAYNARFLRVTDGLAIMTLIACAMTKDHAAMVGDRRLIFTDGRVADDNRNKLVVCEGNVVFGYTGLAHLGGVYTDQWLLERLAKLTRERLDDKLQTLARQVRDAVARRGDVPRNQRRIAILGIGFGQGSQEEQLRPFFCLISNFHGENWRAQQSSFEGIRLLCRPLSQGETLAYESVGQELTMDQEQLVRRRMSRLSERARLSGRTIIPILAAAIRGVARHNAHVGRHLLAVAIPRNSVKLGSFALTAGTGNEDNMTFLYLPDGSSTGMHYGPAATAGGTQFLEVRYGPANRDGSVTVGNAGST